MVRTDEDWKAGALAGGYWLRAPTPGAEMALVFSGALAPEALMAWEELHDDLPGLGLLNVTSPDLLHRGWSAGGGSHVARLLAPLSRDAQLVTLLDGSPAALSWLGGVRGHRVRPLGVDRFGQTGSLQHLYAHHRLDGEAVIDAAAELLVGEGAR
jgi:pyruvate dehydrogenase E1 component